MKYNKFGQVILNTNDLCKILYRNPEFDIENCTVIDADQYNKSLKELHLNLGQLSSYIEPSCTIEEFDNDNQSKWFMPEKYKNFNIEEWLLSKCKTSIQTDRVQMELILYRERNLYSLLCYLKYLVDTMRKNKVIWGVGRGSSVASYVLYLIGIHRIDSIQYDLDIKEFLKDQYEKNL